MSEQERNLETFPASYAVEFWSLVAGVLILVAFLLMTWVLDLTGFSLLSTDLPVTFSSLWIMPIPIGAAVAILGMIRGISDVKQRRLAATMGLAGGLIVLSYGLLVITTITTTASDTPMGQLLGVGKVSIFAMLKSGFWVALLAGGYLVCQFFIPREVNIHTRQAWARLYGRFFSFANVLALIILLLLVFNIVNQTFGLVAVKNTVEPSTLSDKPLNELSEEELTVILEGEVPDKAKTRLSVVIRDELSVVDKKVFAKLPLAQILAGRWYPQDKADLLIGELEVSDLTAIVAQNLSQTRMVDVVIEQVVKPQIVSSWRLWDSLFNRATIEQEMAQKYPDATLEFRSWLNLDFVGSPISSSATTAGLRTALLGSMWIIVLTVFFSFSLGIGAAIYLEEYAHAHPIIVNLGIFKFNLNTLIEVNIRNLAGVPSIIYGMLGLAVFVRVFGDLWGITNGRFVGITDTNGRTVVSAALTMAALILPVIIINAQEAIRAVPWSIREASMGIGATKWQTISRQVLPAALPGILTGIILSMSRAVGETAPLIVVGASTFIGIDPNGPFSKFTVVPIQIYQWIGRPELEFKNVAAAAIIVLLILLVLINGTAIVLRQRFSRRLS